MAVQYGGVSQETLHVAPLDYTAGEVARGGFHKNPGAKPRRPGPNAIAHVTHSWSRARCAGWHIAFTSVDGKFHGQ